MDMVEIWKEKDEGLRKFQSLCKFRIIQIIRAKTAYENSPEGKEYEKEMKQLNQWIYNYLVHSKGYNSIFSRNLPTFIKIFNSLYIYFIKNSFLIKTKN